MDVPTANANSLAKTLPEPVRNLVADAALPALYAQVVTAIEACDALDEVSGWTDQAAALAAYARMMSNREAEMKLRRIHVRAYRRCGELLLQHDARGGDRTKSEGDPGFAARSRVAAAKAAGLSDYRAQTAVRIASISKSEFEAVVESPKPPTASALAGTVRVNFPRDLISKGAANQPAASETVRVHSKGPADQISSAEIRAAGLKYKAHALVERLYRAESDYRDLDEVLDKAIEGVMKGVGVASERNRQRALAGIENEMKLLLRLRERLNAMSPARTGARSFSAQGRPSDAFGQHGERKTLG
jgi:hypothetical protein